MSQEAEIFQKAELGQRVTATALLCLIKCCETCFGLAKSNQA
jgi:hypothetical protein